MTDDELRNLVDNYQPNAETVEAMKQVSLLAVVGPSATGKTTIMEALAAADPSFHFVVGETSREPRAGEQNGVDLFFRSRAEILEELKKGKLTQVVIGPNGDLYCTRVDNFSTQATNLFPLIPKGIMQFRAMPLKFFAAAFVVPATFELWQQWMAKQARSSGWTPQQLQGRLLEANRSFEFAFTDSNLNFLLNDTTELAIKRLQQIAQGQPPADEEKARLVAKDNYRQLTQLLNIVTAS